MDSKVKQEIEELAGELLKYSSDVLEWNDPADPSMIELFEQKFHVTLPDDYKCLLNITNGFSLMGDGILGVTDRKIKYGLFASYEFEHFESGNPLFDYLIPFSPDGFGNFYCLDTRIATNGGASNQIVFWYHDCEYSEETPPEITYNSLADFIKDWILGNKSEYKTI